LALLGFGLPINKNKVARHTARFSSFDLQRRPGELPAGRAIANIKGYESIK